MHPHKRLTHPHRAVGFRHHLHRNGKVLQVVGEEAEGSELLECDALQQTSAQRSTE